MGPAAVPVCLQETSLRAPEDDSSWLYKYYYLHQKDPYVPAHTKQQLSARWTQKPAAGGSARCHGELLALRCVPKVCVSTPSTLRAGLVVCVAV